MLHLIVKFLGTQEHRKWHEHIDYSRHETGDVRKRTHKAWGHIGHKTREIRTREHTRHEAQEHARHKECETQEHVGNEARRAREHVRYKACRARDQLGHEARWARQYVEHEAEIFPETTIFQIFNRNIRILHHSNCLYKTIKTWISIFQTYTIIDDVG